MTTTIVGAGTIDTGLTITNGLTVSVVATGTIASADILNGGSAYIAGLDTGSTIQAGGTEIVSAGSATLDQVYGLQSVNGAGATVSNETVFSGGIVDLATNAAVLNGGFTFANAGGTLVLAGTSPTGGDNAINSGFTGGDMIVLSAFTGTAAVTSSTAGGNEVVSVTSGSVTEKFTFANGGNISLVTLTSGDELLANATTIASGHNSAGLTVTSGTDVVVLAGGTDSNSVIQAGGLEVVAGGGVTGDTISGTQFIGTASTVQNETVTNGGTIDLFIKSAIASNTTLENGGALAISGNATASNVLIVNGGSIFLESGKADVSGILTFNGPGTLIETSVVSSTATTGVNAVISGFGFNDAIELTAIGTGATLSAAPSGSNVVETVTSGTISEAFTFAGTSYNFELTTLAGGGVELINSPVITVASGASLASPTINAGYTLDVLAGGTVTGAQILNGGSAFIAGTDASSMVFSGGIATITGTASHDVISGTEVVSGTDTNNTIALGGTAYVIGTASGDIILGTEIISGTGTNLTLNGGMLELASGSATLTGGLTFAAASTLAETAVVATGYGVGGLISGFGMGDAIDLAIGSGATLTSATSGANAIITIAGGSAEGSAAQSFTFAGGAGSLFSLGNISGGEALSIVNPVITVSANSTGDVASAGYQLNVLASGTENSGQILSGAVAQVAGVDLGSTIALGGTETVFAGGSASNDIIFGKQIVSGTATGETLASGGSLAVAAGGSASNLVLGGGVLELTGATSNLTGGLTFTGAATLKEDALLSPTAVISGFTTADVIDLSAIGTGAIINSSTVGGNTVLTISGGSNEGTPSVQLTMSGTGALYALGTDASGTGETLSAIPILTSFTSGDIVVGVVGDDNNTGYYGDNAAAPIALEEFTASGQLVGEMVLPQSSSGANSVISGELGSASEGILQLSGDGQSLVIMGYSVNAATYNADEAAGGSNIYGTAALAQTTSVLGGADTAVSRVVADISYNGNVDTSTAIYGIFNLNNPRSVTTVNGQTFYLSGQGNKDGTQGVFVAADGSSTAAAIFTGYDTRTAEIYNGVLYVSDNSPLGAANIESFGGLPTGATTPTILSGINLSVTLTAAQTNTLNASAVGTAVALSPEEYFFANATTLYVADGGQPKAGTVGDGGLQKWSLNTATGQWQLDYTLSAGLNLVDNTSISSNTDGATGLIGLTGQLNANGTVTFYATNSNIYDLDQTYVYTITDNVNASTAATGEQFTVVATAAADTVDRGIALAPSAPTNVTVSAGQSSAGLTVSTGSTLTVQAGGSITGAVILSGGTATVTGADSGSLLVAGGSETVYGSATGDNVYGTQIVSGGVSNETVYYGATMQVMSGGTATGITTEVNGALVVSGSVAGLTMSGGIVGLAAAGASISGVTLAGPAEIAELIAGTSVIGVIFGFGLGDVIDLTQIGTGAVLTSAVAGNVTVETVTSGGVSQSFTLAGNFAPSVINLTPDASGGVDLAIAASTATGLEEVTSGELGAYITVASGGTLQVDTGGTVTQDLILTGGTASISGIATNDVIAGSETVTSGATASFETVTGGTLEVNAGATVSNISDTSGTVVLDSGATLGGTLTLGNTSTLVVDSGASLSAVISGFVVGDTIDITGIPTGGVLTSSTSGGNTIETVTSGGMSESFTFTGTGYNAGYFGLNGDMLTVAAPTSAVISAGQTSAGITATSGFTLDVLSGGTATTPIVLNGGTADIHGTESGAVVYSGGTLNLSSGGIETGATILAGGTETLFGPNSATGDQIYGLQQIVSANSATGSTISNETIFNGGTVDVFYKTNTIQNATVLSGGTLAISGNATVQNITLAGGTIMLESPKANAGGSLSFSTGGTLDQSGLITVGPGGVSAIINGFAGGDVIDIQQSGTAANFGSSMVNGNTVLTITSGAEVGETFTFAGTGYSFTETADSAGTGEEITLCFYPGTNIATPDGEVAVEALQAGDLVLTANGVKPVRWVGQSHIHTRFADKLRSLPVRITAGALGNGLPVRDLLLSPDHAVFIGGILAHASALVNDVTIFRETQVPEQFTYYHVELETHELLLAEGAQAESFVDNVDRMHFHNWDARTAPETQIEEMPYPRAKAQRQLPSAVRQLITVAKRA
jgi:autotransporter passenger strand-loop-strand repeat protein